MSNRKPYIRPMPSNLWRQSSFYRFYMLREATALATVWFCIELIYAVSALKGGYESWLEFVAFLSNPTVLVINAIVLVGALLHTKTWFDLAPKAINLPDACARKIKIALWLVTATCSAIILLLML